MLQKALLSVTARERAQLWGFRLPGRWGIIQKALVSATAHEDMQKPFDFAKIWPSLASVHYGAGERYETRGIP